MVSSAPRKRRSSELRSCHDGVDGGTVHLRVYVTRSFARTVASVGDSSNVPVLPEPDTNRQFENPDVSLAADVVVTVASVKERNHTALNAPWPLESVATKNVLTNVFPSPAPDGSHASLSKKSSEIVLFAGPLAVP